MMDPSQWHTGSLGGMHGCVEVKLIDYEEAGYFASSSPPEGEICIRGASIVESYWKDEVETRKAFTNDGWLKTGDIGTKRHFPENILLFGADPETPLKTVSHHESVSSPN
jgi:long-subunit acyl-CoA synthetase (AMP-forming)